jgi:chromosome segregation ATPase
VLGALADQLLTPDRLVTLIREAVHHRRAQAANNATQRDVLRKDLKTTEGQIERMLVAVAEGAIPDMSILREKMGQLNTRRDECIHHLNMLDSDLPDIRQALSSQQAATVAANLKRRLLDAPRALQRRYVRGLVSEIIVDREKAVIAGPRTAIAECVSDPAKLGAVLSSVREWRTRQESNSSDWG